MTTREAANTDRGGDKRFHIAFPARGGEGVDQDEEWCEVRTEGKRRRIRFHDYHEIYSVPGLYEQLFYEELECQSPTVVCGLFARLLEEEDVDPSCLRVLDVGAGNGMVGEELRRLGVGSIVGIDIIEEAASAAERDRPEVYNDYLVADLTTLSRPQRRRLEHADFNCLTSVAALGYGDIPPFAFAEAYNMVSDGGWIAYCIKDRFLEDGESSGFSRLVNRMLEEGVTEIRARERYRHRLSVHGEPLHYVAIVAEKRADVPIDWAREAG